MPLFQPQIIALIEARDRQVDAWAADRPQTTTPYEEVFEDRSLEVASYLDINIDTQVKAVLAEINRRDGA